MKLLERWIGRDDQRPFATLAAGYVFVAVAALVARAAGDAVFLSRFPAELLPWMYLGTAVLIFSSSWIHAKLIRLWSPGALAAGSAVLLGLGSAAITPWVRSGSETAAWIAFFFSDLAVAFPMMLFWGLAANAFGPREAKRYFGWVGGFGTLGCIVAGFLIRPLARMVGLAGLFWIVAGLLGAFAVCANLTRRLEERSERRGRESNAPAPTHGLALLRSRQVRALAILVLCAAAIGTLVDVRFKVDAREQFQGAELAGFFGRFYAWANSIGLLLQLFVVHRILAQWGLVAALSILPIGFAVCSLASLAGQRFYFVGAAKFLAPMIGFSVDQAAFQILYLGIRRETRPKARALVEGGFKPLAIAVAGLGAALVGAKLGFNVLALAIAAGAVCWVIAAWRARAAYVQGLLMSINAARLELWDAPQDAWLDPKFEAGIRRELATAAASEIPYLLTVATEIKDSDWREDCRGLLLRPAPDVRIAALIYLEKHGQEEDLSHILACVADHSAPVRAAALTAAAAIGGERVLEALLASRADRDPKVRATAAVLLADDEELAARIAGSAILQNLLESPDPELRLAAVTSFQRLRHGRYERLLRNLLADPEPRVRSAALSAAFGRREPALVRAILPMLGDARQASAAEEILVSAGSSLLDVLEADHAKDGDAGLLGWSRLPRILGRIGDPRGIPILRRFLESREPLQRQQDIKAFVALLEKQPSIEPHRPVLLELMRRESREGERKRALLANLGGSEAMKMLQLTLIEESAAHLQNLFLLLSVQAPGVDVAQVLRNMVAGKEQNAAAIEVVDNLLKGELREAVLGLLRPIGPVGRIGENWAALEALVDENASDCVLLGSLYAAAKEDAKQVMEKALGLADRRSGAVRETAAYAAAALDRSAR